MSRALKPGGRVAYTAAFLRNTGQFTGPAGFARATYVGPCPVLGTPFVRVRWDCGQPSPDPEVEAERLRLGSLAHGANICRVGTAAMSSN